MQITLSLKVPLMLFLYGHPSRTGESWAGRLICHCNSDLFIARTHLKPAQAAKKAGQINTWLCHLGRKAPHRHHVQPPCWLCCIHSFTLWATILLVSIPTPITFLNCCSSVAWRQSAWVLHPAKISVLNWRQSLFNWLIFVPFVKIPRLLKFSIIRQTQLSGFSGGGFPYAGLCQKSQSAGRSDFWPISCVRKSVMWMPWVGNGYTCSPRSKSLSLNTE